MTTRTSQKSSLHFNVFCWRGWHVSILLDLSCGLVIVMLWNWRQRLRRVLLVCFACRRRLRRRRGGRRGRRGWRSVIDCCSSLRSRHFWRLLCGGLFCGTFVIRNVHVTQRRIFWNYTNDHHISKWTKLVSCSLTSPFSTNIRDKMSGMESYSYPVKEGQRYINLNPGHLFVQQPPKRERDQEAHLNYYASAYNRGRQPSHRKTKLNQIQPNARINLNWAIQITKN